MNMNLFLEMLTGNFSFMNPSNLYKLIENHADVQELLSEECIIQEMRKNNDELCDYFNYDKVKELIDIVFKVPHNVESLPKSYYKLPFVACELLSLDTNCFSNKFFPKENLDHSNSSENADEDSNKQIGSSLRANDLDEDNNNLLIKFENDDENQDKNSDDENIEEDSLENKADKNFDEEEKVENQDKEEKEEKENQEEKITSDNKDDNESSENKEEASKETGDNKSKEENNKSKEEDSKSKEEDIEKQSQDDENESNSDKDKSVLGSDSEESIKSEQKQHILEYLFEQISEESFNITASGYFKKIIDQFLINYNTQFIKFMYAHENFIQAILEKIIFNQMSQTLLKILTFDEDLEEEYLEYRLSVISQLFEIILSNCKFQQDLRENATEIICNILTETGFKNYSEIISYLFDTLFPKIIDALTENPANEDIIIAKNYLIEAAVAYIYKNASFYQNTYACENNLLKFVTKNFKTIFYIDANLNGPHTLKQLNTILILIKCDIECLRDCIINENTFSSLLKLFEQNPQNNILQVVICDIINYIFKESNSILLQKNLIIDCKLVDFFKAQTNELNYNKNGKTYRKENLGLVTTLANAFEDFVNKDIKLLFSDQLDRVEWQEFKEKFLDQANTLNNTNLTEPAKSSNFDDSNLEEEMEAELAKTNTNAETFQFEKIVESYDDNLIEEKTFNHNHTQQIKTSTEEAEEEENQLKLNHNEHFEYQNYWKLQQQNQKSIDELMLELEL